MRETVMIDISRTKFCEKIIYIYVIVVFSGATLQEWYPSVNKRGQHTMGLIANHTVIKVSTQQGSPCQVDHVV